MALPPFDQGGVLPPFLGPQPGQLSQQSPYRATMLELVAGLCTSRDRGLLLQGLIRLRADLTAAGVTSGFQWIDGSFVEQSEMTKGRPPADIDVVTLLRRPETSRSDDLWVAKATPLAATLFNPIHCKATYHCDAYYIDLDADPISAAEHVAFWFGLFSHQRATFRWKGIVQVPLTPDDGDAEVEIARRMAQWPLN